LTAYPSIRALVNTSVGLPCNVTLSSPYNSITLILWYREDITGSPIYTIDARNSPLQSAQHFKSETLKSRANFDLSLPTTGILSIDPLIDTDNGNYWCRVDFRWTRTTISAVTLNVIGINESMF
jgi:hypothetical protein